MNGLEKIERIKTNLKNMTIEQLEDDLRDIYNYLHTDDRCQPISWADVQWYKELYQLTKKELNSRS